MIVVGGGIVGLAIADALAGAGHDVLLVERHARLGQETTARNSEVVHAGLYYPTGSLKARMCVEGRVRLKAFCAESGVPYAELGKLVVACDPRERPALEALAARSRANGVSDVRLISAAEARAREPALACVAALDSPSTAVVDSVGLMLALEARYIARGGTVATATNVVDIDTCPGGFRLCMVSDGCETELTCGGLVLAGGLTASGLGAMLPPKPGHARPPATFFAKGHYYTLRGAAPFSCLVYPLPADGGLGIHYTLSTAGEAKFGPDVEWTDDATLSFDDPDGSRRRAFARAIQSYWPEVSADALVPAYVGIRPKAAGPGRPTQDFAIHGATEHGYDGLVALYGIESPGLTASLAIGAHVAELLKPASRRNADPVG
jgi:L-2-hydroxyglutarate oxidase LhgO